MSAFMTTYPNATEVALENKRIAFIEMKNGNFIIEIRGLNRVNCTTYEEVGKVTVNRIGLLPDSLEALVIAISDYLQRTRPVEQPIATPFNEYTHEQTR